MLIVSSTIIGLKRYFFKATYIYQNFSQFIHPTYPKLFKFFFNRNLVFSAVFFFCTLNSFGQKSESQGWFFLTHQQKLSERFKFLADVQLRSSDSYQYLNTVLLRTGLLYELSNRHSVGVGYAYKGDWEKDDANTTKIYSLENRLFEQYLYEFKLNKTEMMFRSRLEQRWIHDEQAKFSQRARAMLSAQIPIIANTEFSKGAYAGLQNEIFLNVLNKNNINGSLFDQNRTFVSIGYRWSKAIDTELGYQYWFQKEDDGNYRRNVLQLQISTQF